MMLRNRGMLIAIVMVLTVALLAACSGPEEKKVQFYNKGKALYAKGDYVRASLEFKNAIQIDMNYADAYYMLGMIALKSRNYSGAYGSFSKAVELSPQHWDAQVQVGKFLLSQGKMDEAMGKAELVLKADAKNEDALILKGAVLLKKKDDDGARRFLESIVGKDVHKSDGYLLLTAVYAQKGDTQNAEKTLREGIKFNEKSVSLYLSLAEICLKKKRIDEALSLMQKVIEIEPDVSQHRLNVAGLYWSLGKEQQAVDVLKSFVLAEPKKEERWIQVAEFYNARNRPADAEQQLKEGIHQNSKSFKIRFALSAFYLSTNRPDQGVSILGDCLGLEKDPANPNVLQTKNYLAQFYLTRNEIDKAKKYVDEVIKESPKNVDANYVEGAIYLSKMDAVQAVSSFRTVVNERPQFIPGYVGLANANAMNKDLNLAFDALRDALKIAPGSREVTRAMAGLYALQRDFKNAEAQYRTILNANPRDLEVRADLGDLMLRAGDFKRAEEEYADIKRRAPDYPAGYVKLSASYMAQKKWDRAIAELEQAVRIHPELWSTTNDLAILLSEHGNGKKDLDRAFVLGEKARSLNPDNANVFDTVGWIDYRRGEMNQAVDWLAKAQAKVPANPVFNYHLGMAYYRAGNTAKAKEYIQIALASKVGFPEKDEAEKTMAGIH